MPEPVAPRSRRRYASENACARALTERRARVLQPPAPLGGRSRGALPPSDRRGARHRPMRSRRERLSLESALAAVRSVFGRGGRPHELAPSGRGRPPDGC
jgi:hypothetical protein